MGYYSDITEHAALYVDINGRHSEKIDDDTIVLSEQDFSEAVESAKEYNIQNLYICGTYELTAKDQETLDELESSGITLLRCPDHKTEKMFDVKGEVTLEGVHINGGNYQAGTSMISVSGEGNILNISEGTVIEGGNAVSTTTNYGRGGAISVGSYGTVNMTGGTICRNTANQGGAIIAEGIGAVVNLDGGEFSANSAVRHSKHTLDNGCGGGAIYAFAGAEVNMGLGIIENVTGYSDFRLEDIEDNPEKELGNEAVQALKEERVVFKNNTSYGSGGAIYYGTAIAGTDPGSRGRIFGADFENNTQTYKTNLAGAGAIYVEKGSTLEMMNLYVSGNREAGWTGYAAFWTCATGETEINEISGALIIDNRNDGEATKVGSDIQHWATTGSTKMYVSDKALGGGDIRFTNRSGNITYNRDFYQFTSEGFSLRSNTSAEAKQWAEEAETVRVTGNTAYSIGSAIANNGRVKVGAETVILQVEKVWADSAEKDHSEDSVLVLLTRNGEIVSPETIHDAAVILNEENGWSYTWTELSPGAEWSVVEAEVTGYRPEIEVTSQERFAGTAMQAITGHYYKATITNEEDDNAGSSLKVSKAVYESASDPDRTFAFEISLSNLDPQKCYVYKLSKDNKLQQITVGQDGSAYITVELKAGEYVEVEGLPVNASYAVTETGESREGYAVYVNGKLAENGSGTGTVTQASTTLEMAFANVETTVIEGSKQWDDENNHDGVRPQSIKVFLMASDQTMYEQTVTPDASGDWRWRFENLPVYAADGTRLTYTISEEITGGYSAVYHSEDASLDIYDIRNVYTPGKTSRTVEKVWNDADNRDNLRPASVKVQLYMKVGDAKEPYGDVIELNEANGWTYTWKDLYIKSDGNDIEYSIEELEVPASYRAEVEVQGTKYIITNIYEPTTPPPGDNPGGNPGGGDEPGGTPPTPINIEDEGVPLASVPPQDMVTILDEDIPLSAVPMTGDERSVGAAALLALLAAGMMGAFGLAGFKKKEDSE